MLNDDSQACPRWGSHESALEKVLVRASGVYAGLRQWLCIQLNLIQSALERPHGPAHIYRSMYIYIVAEPLADPERELGPGIAGFSDATSHTTSVIKQGTFSVSEFARYSQIHLSKWLAQKY